MARSVTEWVNVTGGISIIARESGEVWFHTPSGTKNDVDPFATPMTGAGAAGSTVGLLDGAINLGFSGIEKRLARPEPTLAGYIVALVGAYHTSVHTPRNLRQAASASTSWGGQRSRRTLKSVRARRPVMTGSRSRICVHWVCPPIDWSPTLSQRASSRSASVSMTSAPRTIRWAVSAIRTAWSALPRSSRRPISKRFKRCAPMASMRPASSEVTARLGSEVTHVEETIEFVASLSANDRIQVVQETYESALIMAEGYNHELLKSEEKVLGEIQQAIGEPLLYGHGSRHSPGEKRAARPAA